MMEAAEFAKLLQDAYSKLKTKNYTHVHVKELYQSIHVMNSKLTLPEFKLLLLQLYKDNPLKYQFSKGSSKFRNNEVYGIHVDGILAYLKIVEETTQE